MGDLGQSSWPYIKILISKCLIFFFYNVNFRFHNDLYQKKKKNSVEERETRVVDWLKKSVGITYSGSTLADLNY